MKCLLQRRNARAFTLIELVFVMLIISLMGSIAIPKVTSVMGWTLKRGATQVAGFLQSGYEQAVLHHQKLVLRLDLDQGEMWAETYDDQPSIPLLDSSIKVEEAIAKFDDRLETAPLTDEERLEKEKARYRKVENKLLKPMKLPEGVKFKGVQAAGTEERMESGVASIVFPPSGFVPQTIIYVVSEKGETYTVILPPLGGKSRIERGELRPNEV